MDDFRLDPQLAADTIAVTDLTLSSVRLMRDANYPWLVLVPRRPGLSELVELSTAERTLLMEEVAAACDALRQSAPCDKLNIAALGNAVRQLHVHVIARRIGDAAWPKPVWGQVAAKAYPNGEAEVLSSAIRKRLA